MFGKRSKDLTDEVRTYMKHHLHCKKCGLPYVLAEGKTSVCQNCGEDIGIPALRKALVNMPLLNFWSTVSGNKNYIAMDEDGSWRAYSEKPIRGASKWNNTSHRFPAATQLNSDDIPYRVRDWKQSLISRPIEYR